MKHFIGGSAVGMLLAIVGLPRVKGISDSDYVVAMIAHLFVACLFGLAAWGLLP